MKRSPQHLRSDVQRHPEGREEKGGRGGRESLLNIATIPQSLSCSSPRKPRSAAQTEAVSGPNSTGPPTPLFQVGPRGPHSGVVRHVVVGGEELDLGPERGRDVEEEEGREERGREREEERREGEREQKRWGEAQEGRWEKKDLRKERQKGERGGRAGNQ